MQVFTSIQDYQGPRGAVVALGNFDGVHKGHQVVLAKARNVARESGRPFGVITFEPHPRSLFCPADPPFRITPVAVKRRLLQEFGADVLYEIPFTYDFSKRSAEDFVQDILLGVFGIRHAVAGHDFVFGHQRGGNMLLLHLMLAANNVGVDEIAPVLDAARNLWSSTRVRDHLAEGNLKAAAEVLGREWEIEGPVQQGARRGRQLGFPTANLGLADFLRPRYGVYAVRVMHANKAIPGVANIGVRPTVDGEHESLEVHLFDFSGDLYGAALRVAFADFIRPEQRFDGLEALKRQITEDCLVARRMLA